MSERLNFFIREICGNADTDPMGTGDKFGSDKGKPKEKPKPKQIPPKPK